MKLINYIPMFLQNVREFNIIANIEDVEIEKLNAEIEKILKESIVVNAESYGLKRYEKIYNIENSSNDLIARRFNILSKINNKIPYTYNWLINKLNNTIGKDNYIVNLDYKKQELNIEILALFENIAIMLHKDLREQLSASLQLTVNLFQTEQCQIYFAGIVHTGDYIEIRQVI